MSTPVVYLLHGDDEFAIAQFLSLLESKLGDAALIAMNLTRLDGRSFPLDELLSIAAAMPFLAQRRIVVLYHPLARLNSPAARQKLVSMLEQIPPTTALVLVEYRQLTEEKERKQGKLHWLEKWAETDKERIYLQAFPLPKGRQLAERLQKQAKEAGGQITLEAAALLASLVGEDIRLADQEIHKLLAYVNYRRPVEPDDVQNLTADSGQGDIFAMVDALGNRDGRKALRMLHRLLEQQDAFAIFGMITRQFRLLLLARDALERGVPAGAMARELKIHPFVADKISFQAPNFSLPTLETVYRRLLDLDEALKTSQIEGDLALETLVADFSAAEKR